MFANRYKTIALLNIILASLLHRPSRKINCVLSPRFTTTTTFRLPGSA